MKRSDLKPLGMLIDSESKRANLILVTPGEIEIFPGVTLVGHEPVAVVVTSSN